MDINLPLILLLSTAVSYTHLTLPTILRVLMLVLLVTIKPTHN